MMIAWLKKLSPEDRKREIQVAMDNLSKCFEYTNNDYFKNEMIMLARVDF